jgi:hypothetical protein
MKNPGSCRLVAKAMPQYKWMICNYLQFAMHQGVTVLVHRRAVSIHRQNRTLAIVPGITRSFESGKMLHFAGTIFYSTETGRNPLQQATVKIIIKR